MVMGTPLWLLRRPFDRVRDAVPWDASWEVLWEGREVSSDKVIAPGTAGSIAVGAENASDSKIAEED